MEKKRDGKDRFQAKQQVATDDLEESWNSYHAIALDKNIMCNKGMQKV